MQSSRSSKKQPAKRAQSQGRFKIQDNHSSRVFAAGVDFREVTRKWERYVLFALFAALLVFVLGTSAVSVFYASQVIHPPVRAVTPINKNLEYDYTSVSFRSANTTDNITLYGWHFQPLPRENVAILVHGFGDNRFPYDMDTLGIVDLYGRAGFNVLAFDQRNSGDSAQSMSAFGLLERDDVLGAIAWAKNQGYKRVVLHGFSTGANAALLAAASPDASGVIAAVLDSPVVSMSKYILHTVRERYRDLPDFPFLYTLPAMVGLYTNSEVAEADLVAGLEGFVPRPVLMMHGLNDEVVSAADMNAAYNFYLGAAVGKASLWNVSGAGHLGLYPKAPDEYEARIAEFLGRVLAGK